LVAKIPDYDQILWRLTLVWEFVHLVS